MTLEVISIPTLLARPRYIGGGFFDQGRQWSRRDDVALAALCDAKSPLDKVAEALGRYPTTIAHRASDSGLSLPPAWRAVIYTRRPLKVRERQSPLQYPYLVETKGEHIDLLTVNALIPRGLPDHVRADVCQEIMLALWEKKVELSELKKAPSLVRSFIKSFNATNHEMNGYAMSLDMPMHDGRSWYDVLPESGALWRD